MSVIERLAAERKARLARFAAAAYRQQAAPPAVAPPVRWVSTTTRIMLEVLKDYPKVTMQDIESRLRGETIVEARHIAMHQIRIVGKKTFPDIARRFGKRAPETIWFAVKWVARRIESDPKFAAHVAAIRQRIEESNNADH